MKSGSILVLDDEPNILKMIRFTLDETDYYSEYFSDPLAALKRTQERFFDVAFVDLKMIPIDGIGVLEEIKRISADTTVVLMTAHGSIETAVEAIKKGAYDYLAKPFTHKDFLHLVERVFKFHRINRELNNLRNQLNEQYEGTDYVTNNYQLRKVFESAADVARSNIPVLIEGESGTGKELLARFIHDNSDRNDKPFVVINCAAVPENLFESELFGYAKGAFTGAIKDRVGRLEIADTGTLFLDEVGDIPKAMQVKLLRFLQNMEFERVGESFTRKIDTRIISATNKNIIEDLSTGKLREDFFYRISGVRLTLPPLRKRKEDIVQLFNFFLNKYSGGIEYEIDSEVLEMMTEYDWPGNIRELENVVKRLMVFAKERRIIARYLPVEIANFRPSKNAVQLPKLEELEKQHIAEVLKIAPGVKEAAKILGISETTLWRKRKLFNI